MSTEHKGCLILSRAARFDPLACVMICRFYDLIVPIDLHVERHLPSRLSRESARHLATTTRTFRLRQGHARVDALIPAAALFRFRTAPPAPTGAGAGSLPVLPIFTGFAALRLDVEQEEGLHGPA